MYEDEDESELYADYLPLYEPAPENAGECECSRGCFKCLMMSWRDFV